MDKRKKPTSKQVASQAKRRKLSEQDLKQVAGGAGAAARRSQFKFTTTTKDKVETY